MKAMKVDIRRNMPIPHIDQNDIQQRRQKKLTRTTNEDKAMKTFGLAKKDQRLLREQQGKVQTRKQAQQEIMYEEQQTKKIH